MILELTFVLERIIISISEIIAQIWMRGLERSIETFALIINKTNRVRVRELFNLTIWSSNTHLILSYVSQKQSSAVPTAVDAFSRFSKVIVYVLLQN